MKKRERESQRKGSPSVKQKIMRIQLLVLKRVFGLFDCDLMNTTAILCMCVCVITCVCVSVYPRYFKVNAKTYFTKSWFLIVCFSISNMFFHTISKIQKIHTTVSIDTNSTGPNRKTNRRPRNAQNHSSTKRRAAENHIPKIWCQIQKRLWERTEI